jgi:hypothetical protein
VAPTAARELTVPDTGSKFGCRLAATVNPVTRRTGARSEEITPHHGTSRMSPP